MRDAAVPVVAGRVPGCGPVSLIDTVGVLGPQGVDVSSPVGVPLGARVPLWLGAGRRLWKGVRIALDRLSRPHDPKRDRLPARGVGMVRLVPGDVPRRSHDSADDEDGKLHDRGLDTAPHGTMRILP